MSDSLKQLQQKLEETSEALAHQESENYKKLADSLKATAKAELDTILRDIQLSKKTIQTTLRENEVSVKSSAESIKRKSERVVSRVEEMQTEVVAEVEITRVKSIKEIRAMQTQIKNEAESKIDKYKTMMYYIIAIYFMGIMSGLILMDIVKGGH